ncbi:hypothetical protein BDR06DRAFT_954604 [Suillus hirtellus]|nr:hypothetical protein BDR06DRAFT_954604 [Suillus hirtellus]
MGCYLSSLLAPSSGFTLARKFIQRKGNLAVKHRSKRYTRTREQNSRAEGKWKSQAGLSDQWVIYDNPKDVACDDTLDKMLEITLENPPLVMTGLP